MPKAEGAKNKTHNNIFRFLYICLLNTVQGFIAIILALLILGDLSGTMIFDKNMPVLSVVGLYFTIKFGVVNQFKCINYLNLYTTFFIGLLTYNWVLNEIFPFTVTSYWWIPLLPFSLVIMNIEIPFCDIPIIKSMPPIIALNIQEYIIILISPFVELYEFFKDIFKIKLIVLDFLKNLQIKRSMNMFIGLIFYLVVAIFFIPHTYRSKFIAWAILLHFVIVMICVRILCFIFQTENNKKKCNFYYNIIYYPLWSLCIPIIALKVFPLWLKVFFMRLKTFYIWIVLIPFVYLKVFFLKVIIAINKLLRSSFQGKN